MTAAGEGTTTAEMLEAWLREELGVEREAAVRISEKAGTDPRCSPIVTEVAVAAPGEEPYTFHFERQLSETTRMDVVAALAFGGGH